MREESFRQREWSNKENALLLNALFGLRDGQLSPLADLLKSSAGGLHPHIAKQLVAMIESDGDWTDYDLETKLHSKLKRKSNTTSEILRKKARDRRYALIVAKFGGHNPGMFEAAIVASCQKLSVGRSTLAKIWSDYKKEKEASIIYYAWISELSKVHGGLNSIVELQKTGKLGNDPPKNYIVNNLAEKIMAAIDHDLNSEA